MKIIVYVIGKSQCLVVVRVRVRVCCWHPTYTPRNKSDDANNPSPPTGKFQKNK